jgi:hypothetical protein
MKYSVVWKPFAEYQLGSIWLRVSDQQAVADASDEIERMLRRDPERFGEPDANGWRIIAVPPLVATFEVSTEDRKATVLSIRYRP